MVMTERPICPGFRASGIAAGIKKNGEKDLGLIVSDVPATVAGVFTQNEIKAAPVLLDKKRVDKGTCRAVIVNSGGANCCTGEQGMQDAVSMASLVAEALNVPADQVLVSSTGVIGELLPMGTIEKGIPGLIQALSSEGQLECATAMMTTDTVPKAYSAQGTQDGNVYTITGMIKGAGMIRPNMATMLCYMMTDAKVSSETLQKTLLLSADKSFNRATVDGDTSTNDTVLLMANGVSGAVINTPEGLAGFQDVLEEVCIHLTKAMIKDGEGVTKLAEIVVKGAASNDDAFCIADTVAHSNLVKTALFGEDANWGRILAAAGRAGIPLNPAAIDIYFDEVKMVADGVGCGKEMEKLATAVLKQPELTITIDVNIGSGRASMLTCDFSLDYVRINADYRS
jgi:glutamate N-acetyltransferase / amino-acid N-acetyltransferase